MLIDERMGKDEANASCGMQARMEFIMFHSVFRILHLIDSIKGVDVGAD